MVVVCLVDDLSIRVGEVVVKPFAKLQPSKVKGQEKTPSLLALMWCLSTQALRITLGRLGTLLSGHHSDEVLPVDVSETTSDYGRTVAVRSSLAGCCNNDYTGLPAT